MKYGQQFQAESVPEWSLHNIDYNTLKEFIKANTTRDQATAIPIPGQQDTALYRFENDFYDELCRQHDRVGLFVTTKADEINRRLQHLSDQIQRLIVSTTSVRTTASLKRQRRFAKFGRAASQLGDEIRDLGRFSSAQVVAFRKILKKYRKWTGSSSLGTRFRENILSDPKSFTRRDFSHLETQCDELLGILRTATPLYGTPGVDSPPGSLSDRRYSNGGQVHSSSSSTLQALSSSAGSGVTQIRTTPDAPPRRTTVIAPPPAPTHYWNEYDDGSEAGDVGGPGNGGYAIYTRPDEDSEFPGMATLVSFFTVPIDKMKKWMEVRGIRMLPHASSEHAPLLVHQRPSYGTHAGNGLSGSSSTDGGDGGEDGGLYSGEEASSAAEQRQQLQRARRASRKAPARGNDDNGDGAGDGGDDDVDDDDSDDGNAHPGSEDVFASDSEFPYGYEAHYAALPSINDQRMARFRETMLLRGALGCYAAALVLLGVAAILINTGRHRLRVEVDAGVTMGVVTSLGFACAALGMIMAKHDRLPVLARLAVWATFCVICVLNGVVLVFVMGNTVVVGAGGRQGQ